MSADMSYQAIPAACDLIQHARDDMPLGDILSFTPRWFASWSEDQVWRRGPRPWPEADRLCRQLEELAGLYPGLEGRNCFLDSRWDLMHYLLCAQRRDEPGDGRDVILGHALLGADGIAEHVRGSQGVPVKLVPAAEVALAADLLESMSVETLGRHYDPVKIRAAGVYKFWADRADVMWEDIAGRFSRFRAFYLAAARHGDDVLVCLD